MRALWSSIAILVWAGLASGFTQLGAAGPSPAGSRARRARELRPVVSVLTVPALSAWALPSSLELGGGGWSTSVRSAPTIASAVTATKSAAASAAKPASAARPRKSSGRGRGRGRGGRGRGGAAPLTKFVGGLEPARLLEHAEEISLARQVQRLKVLEELYLNFTAEAAPNAAEAGGRQAGAAGTAAGAPPAETAVQAILAEGGLHRVEWAALAGVSVAELRVELRDGKRARERIVESNVGLVGHAIGQLKRSCGGRLDQGTTEADLLQEGCISLLRAAERFDVSMGVRFGTYATFWVRAAIRRALHEQTRVVRLPSRVQNTYVKIKKAADQLSLAGDAGGAPSDLAVSEELAMGGMKLSPERVRKVINQVHARPSSLDVALRYSGGDGTERTVVDLVRDERAAVQANLVSRMLRSDLGSLMSKHLDDDEARVLLLRFGLADGEARTIKQCGEDMGLSYGKSKSLLFAALSKMRRPHVALALRDYMQDPDLEAERD